MFTLRESRRGRLEAEGWETRCPAFKRQTGFLYGFRKFWKYEKTLILRSWPVQTPSKPSLKPSKIDPKSRKRRPRGAQEAQEARQRRPRAPKERPKLPKKHLLAQLDSNLEAQEEPKTLPNAFFEQFLGAFFLTQNLYRLLMDFLLLFPYFSKAQHIKNHGFS